MAKLGRPGMSDELREQLWAMWGPGKSFSKIFRAVPITSMRPPAGTSGCSSSSWQS